ncbi:MAG: ribonuclease H-like domain-containing protein [Polyangia bacterium]
MIESTFQLARGLGPVRERALWRAGIARWRDFASSASVKLPRRAGDALRASIDDAAAAFAARDADRLAALLPSREHWRLFGAFGEDAAYLDIETSDDVVGHEGISAIGVLDRRGPRLWLAGRDLQRFPEAARRWSMLVTFNGLSFDVPILRRAFPDWEPPRCHVDLRHVLSRLGHDGGLKAIERRLSALGLARPAHLLGIDGWDAAWLFRRGRDGDRESLRRFAEYNLYDAINLRTLMAWAYNALVEAETRDAPAVRAATRAVPVPGRGDVLYDVSKILLAL